MSNHAGPSHSHPASTMEDRDNEKTDVSVAGCETSPNPPPHNASAAMARLIEIMSRLRDPDGGCPWDIQQTSQSIARYAIEEAYEVVEAITAGDDADLKSELGDLLFQVVFHAQIAQDRGAFDFADVANAISDKMVDRHPHVFGDATYAQAEEQERAWEALKAAERAQKAADQNRRPSVLDDVPAAFPALLRAQKLIKRATRVGFDFPDIQAASAKVGEELGELTDAALSRNTDHIAEEMGDVLFSAACLSAKLGVHAEDALRAANAKFERRFRAIEVKAAARGQDLTDLTLEQMDALWDVAKQEERDNTTADDQPEASPVLAPETHNE